MRGWLLLTLALLAPTSWAAHGLGMGYEPKYPASFKNFDYVNPDAPKGGELTLSASGTFDKLNPFTLKGTPPAGMGYSPNGFVFSEYGLVFDSLMTSRVAGSATGLIQLKIFTPVILREFDCGVPGIELNTPCPPDNGN